MKPEKLYEGNVEISESNAEEWGKKLQSITKITGYLYVYGSLNPDVEALLWKKYRKNRQWYMSDRTSEFLLSKKSKKIEYRINNVVFDRKLFNKVRLGTLPAEQVFSITNIEQRRIAYERMDKTKMAALNPTVIDEGADSAGNPLRLVSLTIKGFSSPFLFLHCFCPTTNREYYLETRRRTCQAAVAYSFGLGSVTFAKEW